MNPWFLYVSRYDSTISKKIIGGSSSVFLSGGDGGPNAGGGPGGGGGGGGGGGDGGRTDKETIERHNRGLEIERLRAEGEKQKREITGNCKIYTPEPSGLNYTPHLRLGGSSNSFRISAAGGGGGGFGQIVQTTSTVVNVAGIAVDFADQTIKTTLAGANFAYFISGSNKAVNVVSNVFKYAPYVGLFVTVGTGSYLSIQKDPATGRPYQSWGVTGTDIGVNIATMYIGTKYGGWYGAGAAAFYIAVKTNVQYQMNNSINPGMIFIMNKE